MVAAVGPVVLPAEAGASDLSVDGQGNVLFQSGPNEAAWADLAYYENPPSYVSSSAPVWLLQESGTTVSRGAGCSGTGRGWSTCTGGPEHRATVSLGGGNDFFRGALDDSTTHPPETPYALTADGGGGDDHLSAPADGLPKSLTGGSGNDILALGNSTFADPVGDLVLPPPSEGAYVLSGGEGDDRLGGPNANDATGPWPFGIWADGGAGNDQVGGSPGPDVLSGGEGNDVLLDGAGNDVVDGGAGNDQLWGMEGNDVLIGGDGNDTFLGGPGTNQIFGGAGDDQISSRAGPGLSNGDTVDCGAGNDTVIPDLTDVISTDCETILIPEDSCDSPRPCSVMVTVDAPVSTAGHGRTAQSGPSAVPQRVVLGRAKFRLRGRSNRLRLPLSARGHAFIANRGQVTVTRRSRIRIERPGRKAKVVSNQIQLTLSAPGPST